MDSSTRDYKWERNVIATIRTTYMELQLDAYMDAQDQPEKNAVLIGNSVSIRLDYRDLETWTQLLNSKAYMV